MDMRHAKLFDLGYHHTVRLASLLDGTTKMTTQDAKELWQVFASAESYTGVAPTLMEFGQWISGSGPFEGCGPCNVVW